MKRRLDGGRLRVVHLATHGFFESPARVAALRAEFRRQQAPGPARPAGQEADDMAATAMTPLVRSGVVLAGGGAIKPAFGSYVDLVIGNASEDGILTAEEVQALDLRGYRAGRALGVRDRPGRARGRPGRARPAARVPGRRRPRRRGQPVEGRRRGDGAC